MPLILPGNVASAVPTAFSIDNSCRFDDGDTAWMEKDSSSVAEKKIGTISFWMKRGNITAAQTNIVNHNDTGYCVVALLAGSQIRFYSGEHDLSSTAVLRDPAAWYHIFANWDTTQGVAANRAKLYVNGVQVTLFATETYPDANDELPFFVDSEAVVVGRNPSPGNYFDGYLAEVVALEGTAAAVTDFGEFDSDSPTIWKPIEHAQSGNKGANGFYLDFKDSSNLGNDAYGGTDFDETDLAAADQATDTPTNNFCTMNPLIRPYAAPASFAQGNCKIVSHTDQWGGTSSTIGMTAGKWYAECKLAGADPLTGVFIGIFDEVVTNNFLQTNPMNATGASVFYNADGGEWKVDGSLVGDNDYGIYATSGDIAGIALNVDDGEITLYKNNSALFSGIDISSTKNTLFFGGAFTADTTCEWNFGGCSAFTISSAATDENGYGTFEYAPPAGYLALCTKNLGSDGG